MSSVAGAALGLLANAIIASFAARCSVVMVIVFDVVGMVIVRTGVSREVDVDLVAVVMVMVMIMASEVMLTAVVAEGSCVAMVAIVTVVCSKFWFRTVGDCAEIAVLLLPLAIMAVMSIGSRGSQGCLTLFDKFCKVFCGIVLHMGFG